jgi:DNA repair exonuclease SbcCD ATPase subunit
MKRIILVAIGLRGFRSYVQPTMIDFTPTAGLKFVAGDNRVDPALESNGAGKSTVFDGFCWIAYGSSIKGLRASDLMSRGAHNMAGMLLLNIDGEIRHVNRTYPPNRLTLDGEPVEQDEIDRLLGLSRSRFLNSVVFGQAVPLFLDLPVPQRGDLLDDVLGLEIWLLAANEATKQHGEQTGNLTQLRLQLERTQGQLEGLPDIAALEQQESTWAAERDARLRELIDRYEAVEAEIKVIKVPLPVPTVEATEARERYREQQAIAANLAQQRAMMQAEHERLIADIEWFRDRDECPTCQQKITAKFSREYRARLAENAATVSEHIAEATSAFAIASELADRLEGQWQQFVRVTENAEAARATIVVQHDAKQRESDDLQRQAVRVRNEKNPFAEQRQAVVAESFRLRALRDEQQAAVDATATVLEALSFWRQGFRRVRLFCLDQVLAELAVETRNSLSALGLNGWGMHYTTATENKSGSLRLGVQVEVEPPGEAGQKFDVFSCGEAQRARLAASLGLASLVQRWAGVWWNTEVWDEPTNWLSGRGVDDLLDALDYRAETQDKSIMLLDHRSLAHSFSETWMVTKDARGSSWERV